MVEDIELLVNKGIVELNATSCPNEATIAMLGVARSGTSMVARCIKELGLYIGHTDDAVYEDLVIGPPLLNRNLDDVRSIVLERNKKFEKWGFKKPDAWKLIPELELLLRNPRFVITFRDPLAIAVRNNIAVKAEVIDNMSNSIRSYAKMLSLIKSINSPCLLVSYEKAVQFPGNFVARLAEFVGLSVPLDVQEKAVKSVVNGRKQYIVNARIR